MDEIKRNKLLMETVYNLYQNNKIDSINLIKTMVDNDTDSMKHSFKIITSNMKLD